MQEFKFCLNENRLIFQNAPEVPKQEAVEDLVAKVAKDGFKNPDGSYFDPKNLIYSGVGSSGQSMGPEDALKYRQTDAKPYVEVKAGDSAEAAKQAEVAKQAEAAKAAEVAKVAGKVETRQETGAQLVEAKTKIEIGNLKMNVEELSAKMAEDFKALAVDISLDGKSVAGESTALAVTMETFAVNEKDLMPKILGFLEAGKIAPYLDKLKLATGVDIQPGEADDALAIIYANSVAVKLRKAFSDRYPRCKEFIEGISLAKVQVPAYTFPYEVKFGKGVDFDVVLKVENTEFDNAYNKYITDNPKANEAPKPPSAQEENLRARAKVLQDSFAGKALSWLGLVKLEEVPAGASETDKAAIAKRNQEAYAAALNGENTFAKWVVWLLGGGTMLDGGGEDIAASLKDMDPKHAAIVAGLQKQAKALPFSLEKAAQKVKLLEGGDGGIDVMPKNKGEFGEIVEGKKTMPDNGVKLSEAYEFGATQKLNINLNGGEMVLSKGTSVRKADGNLETASDADKSFKDVELVLIGQLPVGTIIKGKPVFKFDKIEA